MTWEELLAWVGDTPVVELSAVVRALKSGREPPRGVVLTFDDGYAEWVDVGRRLAERGWPATFFACGAMRAEGALHPVDEYYSLLDDAARDRATLRLPDGSLFELRMRCDEEKRQLVLDGPKAFVRAPSTAVEVLAALRYALGREPEGDAASKLYIDDRGLKELVEQGHRLGGHGRTHASLTNLSESEVIDELRNGAAELPPGIEYFAYPDGQYDRRVSELAGWVGYTAALACEGEVVGVGDDLFALPRVFAQPP